MNRRILYFIASIFTLTLLGSCEEHEIIFDHPFVFVTDNEQFTSGKAQVDSRGKFEQSYAIILSSKTLDEDLVVTYDLQVGSGLKEGVDFELLSPKSVVFPIGLYQNVIHIKWLPHELEEGADDMDNIKRNSVSIVLTGASKDITLGYPGPAKKNSVYTITKFNMKNQLQVEFK